MPTVTTYVLKTATGQHIRQATKVTFEDGGVVKFLNLIRSTKEAIRQATAVRPKYKWYCACGAYGYGDEDSCINCGRSRPC